MSRIRVYIKPFDDAGNYTSYEEITKYVTSTSSININRSIDSTEYDVGSIKISNFSIQVTNDTGKFSDVDDLASMFRYKRSDSLVKIIWDVNDDELQCGAIEAGNYITTNEEAVVLFEGLINDEATVFNIEKQLISFKCFGFDYLLKRVLVPYSSISNGDTIEEVLYACLNQSPFNELVTVDAANISAGNNITIDDKSSLENETVYERLEDILLIGDAVLYIENNIVYVSARTPSTDVQYTFYGEASNDGIENIETIEDYRNGLNRVFNHWTWDESTRVAFNPESIDVYGIRTKSISLDLITNDTKRQTTLDILRTEFYPKKKEFVVVTTFDHAKLALKILDKVVVDYPQILYSMDEILPIYGVAVYGIDMYPLTTSRFSISDLDRYKIMSIEYSLKDEKINFKLREI